MDTLFNQLPRNSLEVYTFFVGLVGYMLSRPLVTWLPRKHRAYGAFLLPWANDYLFSFSVFALSFIAARKVMKWVDFEAFFTPYLWASASYEMFQAGFLLSYLCLLAKLAYPPKRLYSAQSV